MRVTNIAQAGCTALALAAIPAQAIAKLSVYVPVQNAISVTPQNPISIKPQAVTSASTPVQSAGPSNASLDNLTVSQTFPAWQTTIAYEEKTGGGAQFFSNNARATTSVRWDQASQSYIVRETGDASKSYALSAANRTSTTPAYTSYQISSGGTTNTFRLLNPGAANPVVQLTYASYGAWHQTTPGAGFQGAAKTSDTYFVYGIKTAAADMPHSGTGTYATVIDGTFVNKSGPYTLSGSGGFLADFLAGTITFTASPVGTPASGPAIVFGPISGGGTIAFANSGFSANGSNGSYGMNLAGYFFGPAAAEIGAVFRLTGGGGSGNGVMIGKQ
ncbi:MAG TPA: hypothetical protein VJ859_13840 [Allosphingosinicella sp.]|nr:hypothetical protein [Allosphingosinicella sp.]